MSQPIKLSKETIRELQLKELESLRVFKEFCQKNNLLFYFCGGCCIGTLRHQGFIPWDDDIDVFMPRQDYEILLKEWPKQVGNTGRYRLLKTDVNSTFTGNLFSNAKLINNTNHTYKFTDEYHYIYIVEHFAKHYRDLGGMGVRMIIDAYFLNKYLKNNNADYDFINEKLQENNLTKFHQMLLEKADLYFNKGIKDFDDVDVYILSNMTFGTEENRILNERRKYNEEYNNSTEENYIKSRIFPPYKRMVKEYPNLKNKKLLLPLYWLHRDFKILTSKNLKQYQENLSEYKKYDNKEEIDFLDNVMKKSGF